MTRHPMDNVQTYAMIQENIALLEQKLQTKIDAMCTWLKQHEKYIDDAKEQLKGTNPKGIVFNESVDIRCMGTGSIKIHHPSRKHLEGKLREKNELIKEHKDQIERVEKLLGETVSRNRNLNERLTVLGECLDRKQGEINTLEYKLKHCNCRNQIRTWAGAKECKP